VREALLLDLDETLIEEEAAARGAHDATAEFARAHTAGLVDPAALVADVRAMARKRWQQSPFYDYCTQIGISSTEGLWCRFEGDEPRLSAIREWALTYRHDSWASALRAQSVDDGALAVSLAEKFATERRARHRVFPDVIAALSRLRETFALGLITNGARCLQIEKLNASGFRHFFDVVVVSGEFGVGKPHGSIFRHALTRLRARPESAVMCGDSLSSDVDGALSAGVAAIWVNRLRQPRPADRSDVVEVATLAEARALLIRRRSATAGQRALSSAGIGERA
jgi:putative hydrolase of the HAD superfamily